jgi:hypothetical protein
MGVLKIWEIGGHNRDNNSKRGVPQFDITYGLAKTTQLNSNVMSRSKCKMDDKSQGIQSEQF